jgi:hypothetical protein
MKQTPRIKMKRLAIGLVILAIAAAATDIYSILCFLKVSSISWERIFRTEPLHHYYMMALGTVVFGIIPITSGICGWSAWMIFKHLDDISDENHDA